MKNSILFIILTAISLNCYSQMENLKASGVTKEIMTLAKQNADLCLIHFYGEELFNSSLKWDLNSSIANAKSNYRGFNFTDSITFIPLQYVLSYKVYDEDTYVDQIFIQADSLGFVSDLKKSDYIYDKLFGLKLVLNKTFTVSANDAIVIAFHHGLRGENIYAKLINTKNEVSAERYTSEKIVSYFWEVSLTDCCRCALLHIDPLSGEIVAEMIRVVRTSQ